MSEVQHSHAGGHVVELRSAEGLPVDATTTAADGTYTFMGLRPGGSYRVAFGLPTNTLFTAADQGNDDAHDSDVDMTTGVSAAFTAPTAGGAATADQVASGRIVLSGIEVAICDNDAGLPDRGYYRLTLHGGLKG